MAYKVERIEGFIVLTNTLDATDTIEYPVNRVRYKDFPNEVQFIYIDDSSQDKRFQLSELVDATSTPYGSIQDLVDWLRINTNIVPSTDNTSSVVSTVNSTTTPLTASSTFTGTAELNGYADVMVSLKSSHNGTLYMEFSIDGTNWDTSLSFDYDTDRINPPHIIVKGYRYYRTRFTNTSASTQTFFRLQTEYGAFNKLTAPINGTLSENYDAIVTRPTDYSSEVAMGKRQGRRTWNKFGYNTNVVNGTNQIISAFGGTFNIMTNDDTFDIVSSSANDSEFGTGARTIQIEGITSAFEYQTETVALNGTTPVITGFSWLGINRVVVLTSGSGQKNAGTITITDSSAIFGTQATIPAGSSVTQQCIYHTQVGHTFLADYLRFKVLKPSGGGNGTGIIKGYSYSRVTGTIYEIFREPFSTTSTSDTVIEIKPSQPFPIGGREVLYFTIDSNSNGVTVSGRFIGIEERIV